MNVTRTITAYASSVEAAARVYFGATGETPDAFGTTVQVDDRYVTVYPGCLVCRSSDPQAGFCATCGHKAGAKPGDKCGRCTDGRTPILTGVEGDTGPCSFCKATGVVPDLLGEVLPFGADAARADWDYRHGRGAA